MGHCVHYRKEIQGKGVTKWLLRIRNHQNFAKNAIVLPRAIVQIYKMLFFSKFDREIIFFLFAPFSQYYY